MHTGHLALALLPMSTYTHAYSKPFLIENMRNLTEMFLMILLSINIIFRRSPTLHVDKLNQEKVQNILQIVIIKSSIINLHHTSYEGVRKLSDLKTDYCINKMMILDYRYDFRHSI